ncbi:MAG TPA: hypothetical protein VGD61_26455 [Pyrinomonadaceae bacterium]
MIGIVFLQMLVVSACVNPNKLPGIREIAEKEDARANQQTDEAIKASPALQELDAFCTNQVPLALGFVRRNRRLIQSAGWQTLSYSYQSNTSFESVKQEYKKQLASPDWRVTVEEKVNPEESRIEFAGNNYSIKIYHFHSGEDDINYKIFCERLKVK